MGAATATNDFEPATSASREFSAFLRLRHGGASRTTWLVTETTGGNMISVGADAACDWQVRAAFVPPRAFSILVVGERAFVRSGPEPGLLLDGKPVDDNWTPLSSQARIDIGLARFEVRTGYAQQASEEPVLELTRPRVPSRPAAVTETAAMAHTAVVQRLETVPSKRRRKRTMETQEYGRVGTSARVQPVGVSRAPVAVAPWAEAAHPAQATELPRTQARTHAWTPRANEPLFTTPATAERPRSSTIELNMNDLDYAGTLPLSVGDGRSGEYVMSPSLLGSDEITRVTSRAGSWRYLMMGAGVASAYSAWLYLLDRL
jgi:predicted component of type VI protein secretion system